MTWLVYLDGARRPFLQTRLEWLVIEALRDAHRRGVTLRVLKLP